jgi:hypothetical protein
MNWQIFLDKKLPPPQWRPLNIGVFGPALEISLFGRSLKFVTCHRRVHFMFSGTQVVFTFMLSRSCATIHVRADTRWPIAAHFYCLTAWKCFHNAHFCQSFWSQAASRWLESDPGSTFWSAPRLAVVSVSKQASLKSSLCWFTLILSRSESWRFKWWARTFLLNWTLRLCAFPHQHTRNSAESLIIISDPGHPNFTEHLFGQPPKKISVLENDTGTLCCWIKLKVTRVAKRIILHNPALIFP